VEFAGGEHLVFGRAQAAVEPGERDQRLHRRTGGPPPSTLRLNSGRDGSPISRL
jgi:hypothetical protein